METKNKKIIFTVSERQKEDFKVRLQYDGLTQANFFRAVMAGYLDKNEDMMNFLNTFKEKILLGIVIAVFSFVIDSIGPL